ncbi:hypothetical protein ACFLS1_02010 [Verrucomicrobiota bacterium]
MSKCLYYLRSMISHWIEWKEKCALALCSEEIQEQLRQFAFLRFRKLAFQYVHRTSVGNGQALVPDKKDAWHMFETHLVVKTTKQGKRYKDWLFARTRCSDDAPIDVIQGGASLIMRDVVREHLRREYSPNNMVSFNKPLSAEGTFTLEDLLPGDIDPSCEAELHEYEELAERHAKDVFRDMEQRERVAFLAKDIGVSLADKAIIQLAGCKKSVLNTAYHNFMKKIASKLINEYPDDGHESVLRLTMMTISNIKENVWNWGKSEKACAHLFAE